MDNNYCTMILQFENEYIKEKTIAFLHKKYENLVSINIEELDVQLVANEKTIDEIQDLLKEK